MACPRPPRPLLLVVLLLPALARGAEEAAPPPTSPPPTAPPVLATDVAQQIDEVERVLLDLQGRFAPAPAVAAIEANLAAESETIANLARATEELLAAQPTIADLEEFERQWGEQRRVVAGWSATVTHHARMLEENLAKVRDLRERWHATAVQLKARGIAPALLARVRAALAGLAAAHRRGERALAVVLQTEARVAEVVRQIDTTRGFILRAREELLGSLFARDGATLPGAWRTDGGPAAAAAAVRASLPREVENARTFLRQRLPSAPTAVVLLLAAIAGAFALRRWSARWDAGDAATAGAVQLFARPVSVGLALWLFSTPLPYTSVPKLVRAVTVTLLVVPMARIVGPLLAPALRPFLYGLLAFLVVDRARSLLEAAPAFERTLFAIQCLAGAAAAAWLGRHGGQAAAFAGRRLLQPLLRIAALLLLTAFVADLLGYVRLAKFVGDGTLRSGYAAVAASALARLLEGLVVAALHAPLATRLRAAQRHRQQLADGARRVVHVGVTALWVFWVLTWFGIRRPVLDAVRTLLGARLSVGQVTISLGDVVAFGVTVWLSFVVSRMLHLLLEEEIFPRMRLGRGVPYAISRVSSYFVLLVGFFLALGAAGIGLDRLAVLAGALGVGIGFGLQNIVNNFISGLILLFERPIQVGDMVQIGDVTGVVRQIGLRASMLHTPEGAELIVPNANLIQQQVINWTLSDRKRRIDLPVTVVHGSDPERVLPLLVEAARQHPQVLQDPPPAAFFNGFADKGLEFVLQCWTGSLEARQQIRSDLGLAIHRALAAARIAVPTVAPAAPSAALP